MTVAAGGDGAPPPPAPAGERELRECLRGLMALLALPGLCSGKPPRVQLDIIAEAAERLLDADICHISARFIPDEPPLSQLRVLNAVVEADDDAWGRLVARDVDTLKSEPQVTDEDTPLGRLRVARVAMTYFGESGSLTVASRRADFPSANEGILLRAAASLAGTVCVNARLVHERESALRAKDEFLAMLGHELRNPLAPIVTALTVVRMTWQGALPRELEIVDRQVRHLVALVDDLLDIARITRGKIALAVGEIESAAVIARAIEMTRPLMEQNRHELSIDVPATGLPVRVDARRMSQVMSNLLINAAKYTPDQGRVIVSARREGAWVCIRVRDNGIGIDAALLPRLFRMFEQGETTLDRGRGGLGVGLAIVGSLVALHGGKVEAHSEGPGRGAEFVVRLPLAERAAAVPAADAQPVPRATVAERVLVVDDNQDAATCTALLLQAAGHEVTVANDAPGALQLCHRWMPTVVVLDIGLPVMDGYQLAVHIRQQTGAACPRLIALTGYGLESDLEKTAAAGIEAHLVKPVNGDVLLAAVSGKAVSGAATPCTRPAGTADAPAPPGGAVGR